MTHSKSSHIALAEYFCSRDTISPLSGFVLNVAYQTSIWSTRNKTRVALRKLEGQRLDDVGLSELQANTESSKPFWRA